MGGEVQAEIKESQITNLTFLFAILYCQIVNDRLHTFVNWIGLFHRTKTIFFQF